MSIQQEPKAGQEEQTSDAMDRRVSSDPTRDVITGIPDPWANPGASDIQPDPDAYADGEMRPVDEVGR